MALTTAIVAALLAGADPCGVHGHVVDAAGRSVAGARVEVVDAIVQTTTDRAGAYCLPLPPDNRELLLLVTADGFLDQISPPIRVDARRQVDVTLTRRFSEEVTVTGRADSLVGISASASEGSIGMNELATRPLLRSTDVMEAVPGVAMTQHSTGGHAPIILLRGYNLDHGTDFATFLEGVPLNLPSHVHSQGYTDTNFLIPELIGRIDFQKGPYAAAVGDFGTAGAANIELPETIPRPFATFEGGPHNFYEGLVGGSATRGSRRWLYGAEASHYDGPSVVPDNFNRVKGLLQYADGERTNRFRLSIFTYGSRWNATDGYPERALGQSYVTRFGTLDPTDGGSTQRHLVIAGWQSASDRTISRFTSYAQYFDFDLFSNLTFWTRDAQLGDQIEQAERRLTTGAIASRKWFRSWNDRSMETTIGAQLRNDLVSLASYNTHSRVPTDKRDDAGGLIPARVYDNDVNETSAAPHVDAHVRWTPWLRTVAGVRGDLVHARVDSDRAANSGRATAFIVSPKGGVVLGPRRQTELYANAGLGFHSNHANGAVERVNPADGTSVHADGSPVAPTDLVVRTRGSEFGVRTLAIRNLQSSLSIWLIDSDSELIYAPEDGFTVAERPGRRFGIEWNNFYRARRWLAIDADAAWSSARYRTDPNGEGRFIPDAIQGVLSAGVAVHDGGRFSASLRGRYLGRRPLVPDGTVYSRPSLLVNGQIGVRITQRLELAVDAFNLLNREYEDIAYYFATRIRDPRPGGLIEPARQDDFVTHPGEPRTARIRLRTRF